MNEALTIQNVIVAAIVFAAAIWLVVRASRYLLPGKSTGCASGCGSCPSNKSESQQKNLLQLGGTSKTH